MKRSTSFQQKVGLFVFGLFCALFVLEIFLRLAGHMFNLRQEAGNRVNFSSNEIRILCIGESTTAIGWQDSYPSQLQEILQERFPNRKIKVINRGMISKESWHLLNLLDDELDRYKPQVVIAMIGINDTPSTSTFSSGASFWEGLKGIRVVHFFNLLGQHLERKWAEVSFRQKLKETQNLDENPAELNQSNIVNNHMDLDAAGYSKVVDWLNSLDNDLARLVQVKKNASAQELAAVEPRGKEILSNKIVALRYLAAYHHSRGNDQLALVALSEAKTIAPHDVGVVYELGRILRALGKYREGLEFVLYAQTLVPKSPHIAMEAGRLFSLAGDKVDAYKEFHTAMDLAGDNFWLYKEIGQWFERDGFPNDAATAYDFSVRINPRDLVTWEKLITLVQANGDYSRVNELKSKFDDSRKQRVEYQKATGINYNEIVRRVLDHHVIMVAMQYPLRDIRPLQAILQQKRKVVFVENKENFLKALSEDDFSRYFADYFAGDFGHCKAAGNRLIAQNLASVLSDKLTAAGH